MTAYEQKLQERSIELARAYIDSGSHITFDSMGELQQNYFIKAMLPLATLTLSWSAKDYEDGFNHGEMFSLEGTHVTLDEALIGHGLVPHNVNGKDNG